VGCVERKQGELFRPPFMRRRGRGEGGESRVRGGLSPHGRSWSRVCVFYLCIDKTGGRRNGEGVPLLHFTMGKCTS